MVQIISDFAPTSEENEKKVGYTRYQLGAVLLRDDFEVFELMRKTRNSICIIMDDCLVKALERTTKDHYIISFQHYIRQIQIFCDFLEAMDLYSVLAKIFKIFYQRDVAPPKVSYDLSGQVAFGSSDISLEMRGILSPTPGRHRLSAIAMAQESLGLSAKQSRRKLSPKGGKAKGFATLGNLPLVDAGDESKAPPLAMLSPGQVRAEISTLPLARARHEKITLATPLPLTGDSKFPVSPSKRISSDTSWIKASQAMGNP